MKRENTHAKSQDQCQKTWNPANFFCQQVYIYMSFTRIYTYTCLSVSERRCNNHTNHQLAPTSIIFLISFLNDFNNFKESLSICRLQLVEVKRTLSFFRDVCVHKAICVFAGRTTCDIQSSQPVEETTLTCYFPEDIGKSKRDFAVHHFDETGTSGQYKTQ